MHEMFKKIAYLFFFDKSVEISIELLWHCGQCQIRIIINFKMSMSINVKHKASSFK